jgi:NAD(P)-dependent dehydrogenase (short-subunit alcohol dehydrogenase family)
MAASAQGGVAVVTGGSRGIGAAVCRVLAQEGYAVAVNYKAAAAEAQAVRADRERERERERCRGPMASLSEWWVWEKPRWWTRSRPVAGRPLPSRSERVSE